MIFKTVVSHENLMKFSSTADISFKETLIITTSSVSNIVKLIMNSSCGKFLKNLLLNFNKVFVK